MHGFRTAKDPGECVIIGHRNRIELVIVTAGTSDRRCEKRASGRIDLLIDKVREEFLLIFFPYRLHADRQESGCDNIIRPFFISRDRQQVASNLFTDEMIERFITIKRVDDIVPVPPRMLVDVIMIPTGRFSKACYV